MAVVASYGFLLSCLISGMTTFDIDSILKTPNLHSSGKPLLSQKEKSDLKESDIQNYIKNHGDTYVDINGPSAAFMLHLFKDLINGTGLSEAVGHTHGQTRKDVQFSDTVRSFSPKTTKTGRFTFTIPALPDQEKPQLAEIRFDQSHQALNYRTVTILVKKPGRHLEETKYIRKRFPYRKDGILDLTNVTIPFLQKFHGNISIELKVKQKSAMVSYRHKRTRVSENPVLVVYSQDKNFLKTVYDSYASSSSQHTEKLLKSRTKRASQTKKTDRRRKKNKWKPGEVCKLHKFKVDFDLIGWGPWIVHPKKFNARVCFGQCPAPITHEYTPTNHAMLQTLMRMKRPLSAPEPCCVPTKLRPLSMLYFEYDDIVVRHHQDMIAAECGCR